MEMHILHWNTAYASFALAEDKSDGLAILSILFEADGNNHKYESLEVTLTLILKPSTVFI